MGRKEAGRVKFKSPVGRMADHGLSVSQTKGDGSLTQNCNLEVLAGPALVEIWSIPNPRSVSRFGEGKLQILGWERNSGGSSRTGPSPIKFSDVRSTFAKRVGVGGGKTFMKRKFSQGVDHLTSPSNLPSPIGCAVIPD